MNAAVSKNTRCPNQKTHRVGRVKEKYNDERSVAARRDRYVKECLGCVARFHGPTSLLMLFFSPRSVVGCLIACCSTPHCSAFEWYNRFAYPPYDDFLIKLSRERGMNITKDDVDLLPWTLQSGVLLVDRSTMMRIKLGQCNQHKAFVWYHKLGKPTRATFDAALAESQGMDGLKSRDIASLPWDPLQQALRYSKFHEDDDDNDNDNCNSTPEDDGNDSDTEDLTDDSLSSDDRGDVDSRRKRARDWYDTLQKPTRHVFRKIATDANIAEIVSKADIDLLPWNESFQFLLTDQNENVSPSRQRAVLDLARRKVEEEAEKRRVEEEKATAERQRRQEEAAEKQRMDTDATERRHREWLVLEEQRREEERKRRVKEEEEEVKRQTEAAAADKKRKQLEDEMEQRRLETLQRQREEAEAERLRVEEALEAERKAEEEQWRMETLQRQREKAERLRIEEEIEAQRRREEESERRRVELERENAEARRRGLEEEEAALQREAAEERERELEYTLRQHKLKEMERHRLGSSRRIQENRSPERNLAERKLRRQESERRRRRQPTEVSPNRIDEAEALQHNTAEVHDRHHRADHRTVRENEIAAQERRHHSPTRKQQLTSPVTAEGRFLQIYAWYQRMGQPDRDNFKRRLAGMPDIGLAPDDADLLPWAHRGSWVNVRLVQKMVRDYTNAEKARGNQLPWDRATCV